MIAPLLLIVSLAAAARQQPTQPAAPAQAAARDSAVPGGAPAPAAAPVPARAQDSIRALLRRGRRAEAHYEMIARVRAPVTFAWGSSDPCDEIVGRFCLRFDPDERKETPRPEPPEAGKARGEAIAALEQAARAAPADGFTARGLVRLLVEAHRDTAAVTAARRFARAAPGTWGELLLGFALHAAGEDSAAVMRFRSALPELSQREQKRMRLEALLSPDEAARYRKLDPAARSGYAAALWKLADPLYITPGNEALAEHYSRYVWTRMLAELPTVIGMTSWGTDLDELTMRYGVPTSRERIPAQGIEARDGMLEHFDPQQRAFLPESLLTVGIRPSPLPGEPWALEGARARSGYAPSGGVRVLPLALRLTRFPTGDSVVLRVDGLLAADSAGAVLSGAEGGAQAGLWVLPAPDALLRGDTGFVRVARVPGRVLGDTAVFSAMLTLPPGRYVYSAEMLEPRAHLAAQARYLVELPPPVAGASLSDVLVARAFRSGRPRGRDDVLIQPLDRDALFPGDTIGLYAEASGLRGEAGAPYALELSFAPTRPPAAPSRFWGWLRQKLGGSAPFSRVAISWEARLPADSARAPVVISSDLRIPDVSPGLYNLRLHVTDATGAGASAERVLLIRARPKR